MTKQQRLTQDAKRTGVSLGSRKALDEAERAICGLQESILEANGGMAMSEAVSRRWNALEEAVGLIQGLQVLTTDTWPDEVIE